MSVQHPDHHIVATALEMANRAPSCIIRNPGCGRSAARQYICMRNPVVTCRTPTLTAGT